MLTIILSLFGVAFSLFSGISHWVQAILERVYWMGFKDGALCAAILLLAGFLLFHKEHKCPPSN